MEGLLSTGPTPSSFFNKHPCDFFSIPTVCLCSYLCLHKRGAEVSQEKSFLKPSCTSKIEMIAGLQPLSQSLTLASHHIIVSLCLTHPHSSSQFFSVSQRYSQFLTVPHRSSHIHIFSQLCTISNGFSQLFTISHSSSALL